MGEAIGQTLPLAVGVALSPVPIIAVVLMLTTPRARVNGPAFVLGWLLGLGVVGALVLALAGPSAEEDTGGPATWVSWLKLLLGVLLLAVAARQFRGRPRAGEQAPMPGWMSAVDQFGAGKSLGMAALLSGVNPKNLLLAVAGAATIAQTGIPGGQQALAYAVFAVIGSLGVAVPVVIYLALGKRSEDLLTRLKNWMSAHNAVIMSVLCLVIGAKLIGDAITALW
ncbi:GAP family protein [Actinoplanes sp. NPDC024001]|uniref:GAP family protein n=1 Tax=Actinoplanes sp. NPDC024001 TaxID=3154598 RepID=UPI0033CD24A9